jgi:uncharacterized protein YjgD (DUF1641 family)
MDKLRAYYENIVNAEDYKYSATTPENIDTFIDGSKESFVKKKGFVIERNESGNDIDKMINDMFEDQFIKHLSNMLSNTPTLLRNLTSQMCVEKFGTNALYLLNEDNLPIKMNEALFKSSIVGKNLGNICLVKYDIDFKKPLITQRRVCDFDYYENNIKFAYSFNEFIAYKI